jgi:hypothetical protein
VAKMSEEDMDEIIKRDLPGFKVARKPDALDARSRRAEADVSSPDLNELRRKFLGRDSATEDAQEDGDGSDAAGDEAPAGADPESDEEYEDEIVPVEPEAGIDPSDQRSHSKVAVISGKDQKVIGTQG